MSENDRPDEMLDDELLDRVIRACYRDELADDVRPSREVLWAYLRGEPSDADIEVVQAALLRSEAFRREMLTIAEDLEKLKSIAVRKRILQDASAAAPNLQVFVASHGDAGRGVTPVRVTFVAIAAAVVLILGAGVLSLLRPSDKGPVLVVRHVWEVAHEKVDAGLLISSTLRNGGEQQSRDVYETAESAALAGFRSRMVLDGIKLRFQRRYRPDRLLDDGVRLVRIELDDETRPELDRWAAEVPEGAPMESLEAWMLQLPERTLYRISLTSDSLATNAPAAESSSIGIVVTYSVGSQFGYVVCWQENL